MKQKKLAGQEILEHDNLCLDLEDDISEYRRAMEPDIMARLRDTTNKAKDTYGYIGKDFYIVLITTIDRVLRQPKIIPLARKSCPTPVYKQSVWKFKTASGELEFMWSIPDVILYYHILNNQAKYLNDKETADLAKFVVLMENGELLKWVKKENGEKIDAVIKINKEENSCLMN
ncbi:MAG TPA: hypothetical protein VII94_00560 [Candidatus Saccharimonadales bacterium]